MNDDTYVHTDDGIDPLEHAFCAAVGKALHAILNPETVTEFDNMDERDWDALRAYAESRLREIDGPEF